MTKKIPKRLPKVEPDRIDRYAQAAEKAGVPMEEFRLWALRSIRGVGQKTWSSWETGRRPIPDRFIIQFLRERQDTFPRNSDADAANQ